jgi:hypothetical protein
VQQTQWRLPLGDNRLWRSAITSIKQDGSRGDANTLVARPKGGGKRLDCLWSVPLGERLDVDLGFAAAARITGPTWPKAMAGGAAGSRPALPAR